ncbi:hypothetical protein ACHAXH_001101 [Discostella pseudostelligera]
MPANTYTTVTAQHATTMEVENASSSDSTAWWKQNRSNKILLVVALVALSVALGLTLSHRQEEKVDRDTTPLQIIGGSEAVPDRYSYMVSFHDSWGHFCGGSLIIHDIVLTAADCFWEGMEANAMAVVGRHDFSVDTGESIPIIGASFHPTYNQAAEGDNDIIIIFLETEFTASNVGLVKLNSNTSLPFVDQDLTTIGWAYDWIADEVCAYDSNKAERAGFNCPPRQCDVLTTCANIGLEGMCCSAWGYCGNTEGHCGQCCLNGPCSSSSNATLSPMFVVPSTSPLSTHLPTFSLEQQIFVFDIAPSTSSPPSTFELLGDDAPSTAPQSIVKPTFQQTPALDDVPSTSSPPSILQPVISHKPSKFPLSTNYYDNECNCNSNPTTTRISVREGKGVRQQTKDAASTPPPLPLSGRQPSASIMLKRYDVDHPKAQRHPLFTLLGHSAPPASSVGRCYAFIVGSAGHEFASPLIVDATDDDDAAAVTVQAACASTKF